MRFFLPNETLGRLGEDTDVLASRCERRYDADTRRSSKQDASLPGRRWWIRATSALCLAGVRAYDTPHFGGEGASLLTPCHCET
jgi:hypothetical protein